MRWLGHTLAIAGREVRRETRRRGQALAALVLGLLILLVFAFAFDVAGEHVRRAGPGILWVALVFSGMLSAGRAFATEQEAGTLDGLLLAPIDRGAIVAGKFLATLARMVAVEAIVLPTYAVFFDLPALTLGVVGALATGLVGIAALATLFAAVVANTAARETLLPVLVLPVASPLLIAGVRATDLALGGPAIDDGMPWLGLGLASALAYLGGALGLVDFLLEDMA